MDEVINLLPDRIPVLVVDDDEAVIQVTRLVLSRFRFDDHALELICVTSGQEAIETLSQRDDIAIILLDVVMESDDSGFKVVDFIRNSLNNHVTRILLRTGQPGLAPERQVIQDYDINDYIAKTEATTERLILSMTNALRAYRDILRAKQLARRVFTAELNQRETLEACLKNSELLAQLSHDIRTPLHGIMEGVELLFETTLSDDQRRYLVDVHTSGQRALEVIGNTLNTVEAVE